MLNNSIEKKGQKMKLKKKQKKHILLKKCEYQQKQNYEQSRNES